MPGVETRKTVLEFQFTLYLTKRFNVVFTMFNQASYLSVPSSHVLFKKSIVTEVFCLNLHVSDKYTYYTGGVFRTLTNICDGGFCKKVNGFCLLSSQKISC